MYPLMADGHQQLTADEYYGMIHTKKLVDEARAEGLAEGRAEGLAEGRAEERAKAEADRLKDRINMVLAYTEISEKTIETVIAILGFEDTKDEIIKAIGSMNDPGKIMDSDQRQ